MGCDIHCYIEHRGKEPNDHWWSFGGRITPTRNYELFERLAGARGDKEAALVPPRGVPADVGYEALNGNWLLIAYGEEPSGGLTTPDQAAEYVKKHKSTYRGAVRLIQTISWVNGERFVTDTSEFVGRPEYVSEPDHHSHSWLTPDEWESATGSFPDLFEYQAILAAMRELERSGRETRIVFWFDN